MAARVVTAILGLPVLILLLFWGGETAFALGVALLAILGLWEFYRGCAGHGIRPAAWVGYPAAGLFLLAAHPWGAARVGPHVGALLTGLVAVGLIGELPRSKRAPVANLGATLLGAIYVGWFFSHVLLLRVQGAALLAPVAGPDLPGIVSRENLAGAWLVLFVLLTTWATDTGAYFAGRAFGRRRLAPQLSPGKTVEGAVGGFLSALLLAALYAAALRLHLLPALLLGALAGIVAQVGDLSASAIKRELGLKDFGGILPGHGGVLDRFDSLLFTAPVVYYALRLWPRP